MPMRQITVQDRLMQTIQTNAAQAVTQLESQPFVGGNLIHSITLTAGQDNLVPHQLGRQPVMWTLAGLDANAIVWSPNSSALDGTNMDDIQINLQCSASCTISLWIS